MRRTPIRLLLRKRRSNSEAAADHGDHGAYSVVPLNFNYSNSNYHTKDRESGSEEVLIINYKLPVSNELVFRGAEGKCGFDM